MKLVIIDYGMGNLKSIVSAFKYHGIDDIEITHDYMKIKKADKILLPGVGSFYKAMENIKSLGLQEILDEMVLDKKIPILGICLGMQLLCEFSDEDGGTNGFGYIKAKCNRFQSKNIKIPHVGFNQVYTNEKSVLFDGIESGSDFYFTHSYRLESNIEINQSLCSYEEKFIAAYEVDNIFGTQFHPELSQINGLKLLKNFIEYS